MQDDTPRQRPQKLKVAHIVATTEGAIWVVDQLRKLRDDYGHDVMAFLPPGHGGLVDKLSDAGIPYEQVQLSFGTWGSSLRLPRTVLQLASALRHHRFDVVQTHLFNSMLIGRMAAWVADVPARYSMIASPYHLMAHTPQWLDRSTVWMDSTIIPSCEKTHYLYQKMGVPSHKLALIYYGPDESLFNQKGLDSADITTEFGWPCDTQLVVHVAYFYPPLPAGRWTPKHLFGRAVKGHEDLVEAFAIVASEHPNAKLIFVGSGWGESGEQYRKSIRQKVTEMGLDNSITFLGFRPDVRHILRRANVAVQCSLEENLGGTIEALMIGRPIVATRVGGMVDIVIDEETGLLANPADPPDLAKAINTLLDNREFAERLANQGHRLAGQRFSLSRTVADLDALYHDSATQWTAYRSHVTVLRGIVLGPIICLIAARLLIADTLLPIYIPIIVARIKYAPIQAAVKVLQATVKIHKKVRSYFFTGSSS